MLSQRSQPTPGSPGSGGVRRRPSGEPPPLPRPVDTPTRVAGAVLVLAGLLTSLLVTKSGLRLVTHADLAVLRGLERLRWRPLTDVARVVVDAGSAGVFRVLAWSALVVLLVVRRFQHLFATLVLLVVVPVVVAVVRDLLGRMRPAGVDIAASWSGYSYPSRPVTEIALVLTVATLVLAPQGAWRRRMARSAAAVIAALVLARLYTAVDHPSDVAGGARPRRRGAVARAATGHPRGGVPGQLPPGRARPSRRRRTPRHRDPPGIRQPARRPGHRGGALCAPRQRRLHATADHHVGRGAVRKAVRVDPHAFRPLVQAGPHRPLRPARGRTTLQLGSASGAVRGLHAPACSATPACRRRTARASSRSPRSASTCWSPSSCPTCRDIGDAADPLPDG